MRIAAFFLRASPPVFKIQPALILVQNERRDGCVPPASFHFVGTVTGSVAAASTGFDCSAAAASVSPSPSRFGQMWKPPWLYGVISHVPQIPLPSRKPR